MDAFLRRRNTDNNLISRDTVLLESLYQLPCPPNDNIRSHVLLYVYKGEVLTGVLLDKGSTVLSKLFKISVVGFEAW